MENSSQKKHEIDTNIAKPRKLHPIKSVEQMILSYYAAKAISLIRKDFEAEAKTRALKYLPALDVPENNERVFRLYKEFAIRAKMHEFFVYAAKVAIEDMYKYNFHTSPSVTGVESDEKNLYDTYSSTYKLFAKISLFEHSLDVFEAALKLSLSQGGGSIPRNIGILSALLHDFGKSPAILEELTKNASVPSRGRKRHPEVSAIYVRGPFLGRIMNEGLDEIEDLVSTIAYVVENHHLSSHAKKESDFLIKIVQNADNYARKEEARKLLEAEK